MTLKMYKGWKIEKVIGYFIWDIGREREEKVVGYKATRKIWFFPKRTIRALTIKELKEEINK